VRRELAAVVAILSIAATYLVEAQRSTEPVPDAGVSIVMRCQDCGTIQSIREAQQARPASPDGTASASPVGLVMSIPLGRKPAPERAFVGSVGSRQWQERTSNTRYEFIVRMDDGSYRTVSRQGVSDFSVGNRVKVNQLQIEHWTQ
jgi:outer membrane lipoprotein SlyB